MADWPLLGAQKYLAGGQNTVTTALGTITANAAANTKGSYVALYTAAGNTQVSQGLMLQFTTSVQDADFLVDIALGAAGSEQVVVSNLLVSAAKVTGSALYYLPVSIPSGQRVAVRCQCSTGSSQVAQIGGHLIAQGAKPSSPLGTIATYGANTSDSGGVSIDPGGTAHTKGSYSEITSATTRPHAGLIVALGNQANTARTAADFLLDIAIGGSGSETVLIANLDVKIYAGDSHFQPSVFPFLPIQIPEGTRLAVRSQASITDATDRLLDVVLYGAG